MQRNGQGHFIKHFSHQIGAAQVNEAVDVLACQCAHCWLVLGQLFRQESTHQQTPALHVLGLVFVHHGAVHGVAVAFQNVGRGGTRWRDFFQRYRRREQQVVAKYRLHIVIARDHPIAHFGAIKHRLGIARPLQQSRRIFLVRSGKRIEASRVLRYRAAGGRAWNGTVVYRALHGNLLSARFTNRQLFTNSEHVLSLL